MFKFFQKRILSFSDADAFCIELAEKISRISPDGIVSIRTGGWYVGKKLSKQLGCRNIPITVRRTGDAAGYPASVPRLLFTIVLEMLRRSRVDPEVMEGLSPEEIGWIFGKRIVVVDDAVDTGRTIEVAREYIAGFSPECLMTAVLVNRGSFVVDYSVAKGFYCYPWSRVSPHYAVFRKMFQKDV